MEMDISPAAPPPSSSPQARAGLDETPETAPVPAPTTSKTAVDGKSAATADARPIVIAEKSVDDRGGRGGKKPGLSSLKIGALGKGRKTSPAPPTPIGSRAPSLTRDGSLLSPQDRDTRGRGLAKSKQAPATGSGAPGYDLKKYSAVSFNPQPSVDIIAVYDFEETAEDAWRDDSSSGQPRGGRQRDGSERDRESSRGSQRRRRREPSPLAAGEDGLPVALKATSQPGPSADGKAKIPSESKPNDSKSKNPRKDGKERPKIREGSIRSNPRSSIEVPDRRDNNQKRPESVHWLKDILCQDINRSRILTFSYPVVEKKPRYSLTEYVENAAKELLRKVKSARKGFIRGGVPIVFVGYGFGGIIIQKAMQLAVEEVKRWKKLHGGNDGAPAETTDDKIAGERNPGAKAQVSKDETAAAPFPVNDVCRLLFLDTPFPDMGSEGDPKWFPPNLNVRMCQILQQIKSQEKGSWVNSIWNDFATTTAERGARYSMYFRPVSWLYSKPKGAETDREGMDTLNIREFMASATYDLTFSVASTTKHRRLGRIPNAQDYVYRDILTIIRSSLLFHAIETQQVELVTALSKALKSQPEIVDGLLRTPLHIAAQLNPPSEKIVEILASDRPDDPTAQDCDGNQPLHYAVQRAFRDNPPPDGPERAEYENVIRCLLRNMPPNNKGVKNISGKNPWSICLVCESECEFECEFYDYLPGADYEWIWSLRDNPEPISGPVVDPGDTEPKRPKAPHKELPQYKDIFKTGIVAEFFHAKDASGRTVEHITWKTTSINEMIYDHDKGCAKVLEVGRAKHYANAATAIQEKDFRCRWLHIPANNEQWAYDLFLSIGVRDLSLADQRYDGHSLLNRYMNPQVKTVKYKKIDITDENMPTWKFDASVTDFQQAAGASLPPTPGLATLLEEPAAEQKPDSEPRPPLLTSMSTGEIVNQISKTYTYWEDLPPVKDKGGDRTIALFMPFLAFESHRGRNDMTMDRLKTEKEMENLIKDELRYTELWNPDHTRPLHYRRTLDQYSYYMLDSTERRDWDQVMYRWAKLKAVKARQTFEPDEAPILMVDQLWMWVLPDGTVVTSIPSTQKPAKYSLEKVLEAEFWSKSRHAIKGPESLFSLVLRQCVNVMKREGPCKLNLQESFQSAINNLAESEAVKMKELLKVVKKLKKEPDPFRLTADIDKFSQISEEMYQLVEIVDIQDELAIINSVLTAQKSVLRDLRDHVCCERKPSSTDPPNSIYVMKDQSPPTVAIRKTAVDDSIRIVDENIRAVKEMAESAKRVHTDLKQLLDFKQQQASGWESRYSMKLSEQGQRQNTIMLTFTIVTIVFLPLSFIASFLAISVQEFPHDEESGEVMWGMGAIIEYLFGISIAVSAFILLVIGFFFFRGKQKGRSTSKTPKGASDRRLKARAMSLYESDDSDSDEPSLKPKNYGGNDDGDDESGRDEEDYEREALRARYASLLSKWRWHTHIPGVRRLWLWKLYPVSRSKRHRLRSQEQWEWDYPLRRLRGIDFSLFWKNNSQPVAESYWSKHGDNDDGGDAPSSHEEENSEDEGEVAYGREIEANDGEDSECHSIDERARRETIELEHNDRVQERKNWLGSLFGQRKHGKESRHGDEVEWDEGRSQEGGRASPDAATGATPEASSFGASLAGMFRKRNKQAELDEEMGLGPGPGPGASGV